MQTMSTKQNNEPEYRLAEQLTDTISKENNPPTSPVQLRLEAKINAIKDFKSSNSLQSDNSTNDLNSPDSLQLILENDLSQGNPNESQYPKEIMYQNKIANETEVTIHALADGASLDEEPTVEECKRFNKPIQYDTTQLPSTALSENDSIKSKLYLELENSFQSEPSICLEKEEDSNLHEPGEPSALHPRVKTLESCMSILLVYHTFG